MVEQTTVPETNHLLRPTEKELPEQLFFLGEPRRDAPLVVLNKGILSSVRSHFTLPETEQAGFIHFQPHVTKGGKLWIEAAQFIPFPDTDQSETHVTMSSDTLALAQNSKRIYENTTGWIHSHPFFDTSPSKPWDYWIHNGFFRHDLRYDRLSGKFCPMIILNTRTVSDVFSNGKPSRRISCAFLNNNTNNIESYEGLAIDTSDIENQQFSFNAGLLLGNTRIIPNLGRTDIQQYYGVLPVEGIQFPSTLQEVVRSRITIHPETARQERLKISRSQPRIRIRELGSGVANILTEEGLTESDLEIPTRRIKIEPPKLYKVLHKLLPPSTANMLYHLIRSK